ncbi:MAG: hypothetical protein K1X83_07800 [Oligoflexia bacterium]|nr:hypothetical protein [Oligoflexia bacterium]
MVKVWRHLIIAGAIGLLLTGGVSLMGVPDYELLYAPIAPSQYCTTEGCYGFYTLEVANSGWEPQENIGVQLNPAFDRLLTGKITASNFGKVRRPIEINSTPQVTKVELGRLEAGKRVEIKMTMFAPGVDKLPSWESLLFEVTADTGPVKRGQPELVSFGRLLFGIFSSL